MVSHGFSHRAAHLGLAAAHELERDPRRNRHSCRSSSGLARDFGGIMNSAGPEKKLELLSVVIPARDEEGCVAATVEHLHIELQLRGVPHEIVVVDDGSTDRTWEILETLQS